MISNTHNILSKAAVDLMRRENPTLVVASGLIFKELANESASRRISEIADARGGIWGDLAPIGQGFPILRSTNMRGVRIDVSNAAWCNVFQSQAEGCMLKDGDILVTKSSGSSDLVGKSALFYDPLDGLKYLFSNFSLRLRPSKNDVLPEYLAWYLRSPQSLAWRYDSQQNAVGLRNLQTRSFLSQEIPLPSMKMQAKVAEYLLSLEQRTEPTILPGNMAAIQHTVARMEELSGKIEEARRLREEAQTTLQRMGWALAFGGMQLHSARKRIGELLALRQPDIVVKPDKTYQFAGVYCFGKGVFQGGCKSGMETSYTQLTQIHTGNFVYPKLMAWEGALGIVPAECDGLYVSPEFPVFELNQNVVLPETLDVYFRSSQVWPLVSEASKGTNVRRRRMHPSSFLELEIPLPTMHTQLKLRDILKRTASIRFLQSSTAGNIEALLPSLLDAAFSGRL